MAIEANKKDVVDGRASVETVVRANGSVNQPVSLTARSPSFDMRDIVNESMDKAELKVAPLDSDEKQSLWEGSVSSETKESSASENGSSMADSPKPSRKKFGRKLASILRKSKPRGKYVETKSSITQTVKAADEEVDSASPRISKKKSHFASMVVELKTRLADSGEPLGASEKATTIAPEKTKPPAVQGQHNFASIVAELNQKLTLKTPKCVQGQEAQNLQNGAEASLCNKHDTNMDEKPAPLIRSGSLKRAAVGDIQNDSIEAKAENVNDNLAPLVASDSLKQKTLLASPYAMEKQLTWHGSTSPKPVFESSSDCGSSKISKPRLNAFVRLVKTRSFTKAPRYPKTPTRRAPQQPDSCPTKSFDTVSESAKISKSALPPKPPTKKEEGPKPVELQVKSASPPRAIPKIPQDRKLPRNQEPAPATTTAGPVVDPFGVSTRMVSSTARGIVRTRSAEMKPSKVQPEERGVDVHANKVSPENTVSFAPLGQTNMTLPRGYRLRRRLTWNGGSHCSSTSFQPINESMVPEEANTNPSGLAKSMSFHDQGGKRAPQNADNFSGGLKTQSVKSQKKNPSANVTSQHQTEYGIQHDGNRSRSVSKLGATGTAADQTLAQGGARVTDGNPPKLEKVRVAQKLAPGILAMVKRFQSRKSHGVDEDGSLADKYRKAAPMTDNGVSLPGSISGSRHKSNDLTSRPTSPHSFSENCDELGDVALRPDSPNNSVNSPLSWDESLLSDSIENRLDDNATLDSGMISFNSSSAHQQIFEFFDAVEGTFFPWLSWGGVDSASRHSPPEADEEYPRSMLKVEIVKEKKNAMETMQEKTAEALETTSGAVSRACEEIVDFQRSSGEFAHDMFEKARVLQQQASAKFAITDGATEGQEPKPMAKQTLAKCNTPIWNWFPLLCGSPGNSSPLDDVLSEENLVHY